MASIGSNWRGRAPGVALWVLKAAVAAVFAAAAAAKLTGQPMMVAEFGRIGLGQGFRIFTGLVEIAGAGLLIWPRTAFWGSLVLLAVSAGAFVAQAGPLHGDLVHVVVLAALVAVVAWAERPRGALSVSP